MGAAARKNIHTRVLLYLQHQPFPLLNHERTNTFDLDFRRNTLLS